MHRRTVISTVLGAIAGVVLPGSLLAQGADYPNKPIRFVVPFAPGGATDVAARLAGSSIERQFKQPVVVDNRPGALTQIGAEAVVKAAPDGYTLLFTASNLPGEEVLNKEWPFRIERDFTPIGSLSTSGLTFIVNPALPVRTLAELIAYVKANPGKLNQGMAGSPALELEEVKARTGMTDVVPVLYKGGPLMIQSVIAGDSHFSTGSPQDVIALIKEGRVRAVAYTERERHPLLPDVPTVAESGVGLPDFNGRLWFGLIGPANLPAEVVRKLSAGLVEAIRTPEVRDRLVSLGQRPFVMTPADFRADMLAQKARIVELVARAVKLR